MADTDDAMLLAASAAEARRIAPELCANDPETGESCAWYHGFWPTLRALDLVTTPNTHRAFYTKTLGALAQEGYRRVLISGSADFTMLQQVYVAFDEADATPEITLVDRCPTPVALAEWYAAQTGRSVNGRVCDILDFRSDPFDIVCTHSFMGFFTDERRARLAQKWAELLRPGGKVVTINRIRPGASGVIGFTTEQARKFVSQTREAAMEREFDGADIAVAAEAYAEKFRIRPVGSRAMLEQHFEDNGFSADLMESISVKGYETTRETGPTTPGGADYVHIVATRR